MPKIHIKQIMTPEMAMEWMRVYDEQAGNISAAAKVVGVDRRTFKKYYDEFWDTYTSNKLAARRNAEQIDFSRIKEVMAQNKLIREKLIVTIVPIIDELTKRVNDPLIVADMEIRDLIQIYKELAPYVMAKASDEDGEQNGLPTKRASVQKFIQNIYNINKDNDNKQIDIIADENK